MITADPTESVHSELILESLERFFSIDKLAHLGCALAYPILNFNDRLVAAEAETRQKWVDHVVAADLVYSLDHHDSNLFAFYVARPDKGALESGHLARRLDREDEREQAAMRTGGRYFALEPHQVIVEEVRERRIQVSQLYPELLAARERIAELEDLAATVDALSNENQELQAEVTRLRANGSLDGALEPSLPIDTPGPSPVVQVLQRGWLISQGRGVPHWLRYDTSCTGRRGATPHVPVG